MAGRDYYENTYAPKPSHIEKLVALLEQEMQKEELRDTWIESLEFFETPHVPDGVEGLEAKLEKVGRSADLQLAFRFKEMFAKFLDRYALYKSAQELIALCLHKVFYEFEHCIHPLCGEMSLAELDGLIAERVVAPLLEEYASGTFSLNHGIVQGMIYWLADRCFVRWHAA
jgi:hypothetical protein